MFKGVLDTLLKSISCSTQLGAYANWLRVPLIPLSMPLMKILNSVYLMTTQKILWLSLDLSIGAKVSWFCSGLWPAQTLRCLITCFAHYCLIASWKFSPVHSPISSFLAHVHSRLLFSSFRYCSTLSSFTDESSELN